jgi:hypothetical protein
MNRTLVLLTAAVAPLLTGCPGYNIYEIRLEPTADGIKRTFTGWREPGLSDPQTTDAQSATGDNRRLSDAELERLEKLFHERVTKGREQKQTFSGTFSGKLPDDVGGFGTYRRVDTPLGSAHWYVERFRGTVDADAELFARRAAADRLADLVVGWFDEQMKDSPHHAAVRKFLHQEFRQDLRNVVVCLWDSYHPTKPAAKESDDSKKLKLSEPLHQISAYLAERGYLDPDGPLALSRFYDDSQIHLPAIRRLLARKSGLSFADADAAFPFLADQTTVGLSIAAYLQKTPEFEALRKAWKPDPNKPEGTGPDPFDVVGELIKQAYEPAFWLNRDQLALSLALPLEPYLTNGEYDPDERAVQWHTVLPTRREAPCICQAAWATPDEKTQRAVFGKIRLDGMKLAMFAVAYADLTAARQKELQAHVEAAGQDKSLQGKSVKIRFTEPLDDETRSIQTRMEKIFFE